MKLKSITILGRTFKIKKMSQDNLAIEIGSTGAVGAMSYSEKLILIAEGLTEEDELLVTVHEAIHAAQFITGLNQITDPLMAEIWCETMANTFLDLFGQIKPTKKKTKKK